MKEKHLRVLSLTADGNDIHSQAGSAAVGESVRVADQGGITIRKPSFQSDWIRESPIPHSAQPEQSWKEILFEEIGLFDRQTVRGEDRSDKRVVPVIRTNAVDQAVVSL